jgi:redox-sensitive bicupin YhaK (pirin superfamily)
MLPRTADLGWRAVHPRSRRCGASRHLRPRVNGSPVPAVSHGVPSGRDGPVKGARMGGVSIERVIAPRRRRVGASEVDRLLPFHARRMVGPFIFADLIGPEELAPGVGADVPPHPHVGLATVTYLFDGAMVHRDSTGAVQRIDPGGVNWMTAGSGVAHSERSPDDARVVTSPLAGLQTWVALPDEAAEVAPSFQHASAEVLPAVGDGGVSVRLLVGTGYGATSPVPGASPLFHADVALAAGSRFALPPEHEERAVLVVDGDVSVGGVDVPPRHLAVVEVRGRCRCDDDRGTGDDVRRGAGRAPVHLVELRRLEPGAHRGRQDRLGRAPHRRDPRRDRARRAAGELSSLDPSATPRISRAEALVRAETLGRLRGAPAARRRGSSRAGCDRRRRGGRPAAAWC